MNRINPFIPIALLSLAACQPGGTGGAIDISGHAAIGASSGSYQNYGHSTGSGPPPGRTVTERQARKDYYRGGRAQDF